MTSSQPHTARPGIVCIVASQRSGATLLGRLLGRREGVFYAGQLATVPTYAQHPDARCSCGAPLCACDVWGPALERIDAGQHADAVPRVAALAAGAAEATGARWVVDTSRSLTLARRLYATAPERVRIVHLIRHGRGVAYSRRRAEGVDVRAASRAWAREIAFVTALLRTVPRRHRMRVRYATLCADPDRAVTTLCDALGLSIDHAERGEEHIAFANPARMRPLGPVVLDDAWRHEWTREDEAAFHPAARVLCRALGYDPPAG